MYESGLKVVYDGAAVTRAVVQDGGITIMVIIGILVVFLLALYVGLEYLALRRLVQREQEERLQRKRTLREIILMKEIQTELDHEIEETLQQTILTESLRAE